MKRKEKHTFYNFQFKHTAVTITNQPNIQSIDVAEALKIHPIMLYRWRQEMQEGTWKIMITKPVRGINCCWPRKRSRS